jgi:hypothetical protein
LALADFTITSTETFNKLVSNTYFLFFSMVSILELRGRTVVNGAINGLVIPLLVDNGVCDAIVYVIIVSKRNFCFELDLYHDP